jgi:purine-nucleoside phosphorylase
MTAALGTAMRQAGLEFRAGHSWTIDTPYRETIDEVRHYQAEGVLCVEMEAAGLFAVAQVRGLRLAAAFAISDSLADLVWSTHFRSAEVTDGLIELHQAAVAALMAVGEDAPSRSV